MLKALSPRRLSTNVSRLVAVLQVNSGPEKEANFLKCRKLLEEAKERGAAFAFLPECFDFIGDNAEFTLKNAESLKGPLIQKYQKLARDLELGLSLGGFHERVNDDKAKNTHLIIDSKGEIVSTYQKLHLFDVSVADGINYRESKYVKGGTRLPSRAVETPIGRIGLAICYDLRFPEISLYLRQVAEADILTFPSAFTVPTGEAHWEVLLRSRAIENQCYVIAAAQVGVHNAKRSSYGRSMIIDPWGKIIADAGTKDEGIITAEIDLSHLHKIRKEMPVIDHRRTDLYGLCATPTLEDASELSKEEFSFGEITIPSEHVLFATKYSYCSVNKSPIVPGHVLVMPRRAGAISLADLTVPEVSDLFCSVQRLQKCVMRYYEASSSTVSIQDGVEAGRTISHLHVHVVPRKPGDFEHNDDVYKELDRHDKEASRKGRSREEMTQEAYVLRKFLMEKCFT